MPSFECKAGCQPQKGARARWHRAPVECDYDPSYNPNHPRACHCRGIGATPEPAKPTPETTAEPPRPEKPSPPAPRGVSRLEASPQKAEIIPARKIIPAAQVEFYVDAPHVIAVCNRGMAILHWVTVRIDDYFEFKEHMPRSQFRLTSLAEMTIQADPKNFYTKGVTWACRAVGCRTQQQAHAAIDTFLFFTEGGTIFVALVMHYHKVYKESPKLQRNREKKKVAEEARRLARLKRTAIDVEGKVIPDAKPETTAMVAA